jgi:hypothetical protein
MNSNSFDRLPLLCSVAHLSAPTLLSFLPTGSPLLSLLLRCTCRLTLSRLGRCPWSGPRPRPRSGACAPYQTPLFLKKVPAVVEPPPPPPLFRSPRARAPSPAPPTSCLAQPLRSCHRAGVEAAATLATVNTAAAHATSPLYSNSSLSNVNYHSPELQGHLQVTGGHRRPLTAGAAIAPSWIHRPTVIL